MLVLMIMLVLSTNTNILKPKNHNQTACIVVSDHFEQKNLVLGTISVSLLVHGGILSLEFYFSKSLFLPAV